MGVVCFLGICYGMNNITTMIAAWNYYPQKKGMVSGVLLSSHGFLGIFFNFSFVELINPHNLKANIYVQEG